MKTFECIYAGFAIVISLATIGCSDNLTPVGTYSGTFTVQYDSAEFSGETTLRLSDGQYTCDGNDNRIPAGGSGTYSLAKRHRIMFHDENLRTADFDWNLILKGAYNYVLRGEHLHLTRTANGASYKYDLTRRQEK